MIKLYVWQISLLQVGVFNLQEMPTDNFITPLSDYQVNVHYLHLMQLIISYCKYAFIGSGIDCPFSI